MTIMMLLFIIVGLTIGLIYLFKLRYKYWERLNVPYLKPSLLFGNIAEVILLRKPLSKIYIDACKKYKDAPFVGLFYFWTPSIAVQDSELIKSILIKNFNNFEDHFLTVEPELDPILALNPVCLKGNAWKNIRTKLSPLFTTAKLKYVIPVMQKVGDDLAAFINTKIDSDNLTCFNAKDLATRYTGESVFMAAYGLEGKSFVNEVPYAIKIGEEISGAGNLVHIKHLMGFFFPTLRKILKYSFIGNPVPKSFKDLVMDAVEYRKANNIVRNDYLDYILKLKPYNNDNFEDELIAHAYTVYLDGFETTSILITHVLYELVLNPDVQEKCRNEAKTILEKYNHALSYEAVSELEYITGAIFETLRKHSPLTVLLRYCTNNFEISFRDQDGIQGNVMIEKGTLVGIPTEIVHYNPKLYPNPDLFRPERFTSEAQNNLLLGFGEGPRVCLGSKFAMLQIKIFIVSILTKYVIRMNKKTVVPYEPDLLHILNVPKDGVFIDCIKLVSK